MNMGRFQIFGLQGKGREMKPIIEWLIKRFLKGWHLARNPAKGRKNKIKAVYIDPPYSTGEKGENNE